MKPEDKQPTRYTAVTGSDWQRQALEAARAGAAAARKSDAASPSAEAARQRAAAQQVPDMLAPADPQPAQQTPAANPAPPVAAAPPPSGGMPARPVVGGAGNDAPIVGATVVGTGGMSAGKKALMVFLVLVLVLAAGAAGYFFFFQGSQDANGANRQQENSTGADSGDEEENPAAADSADNLEVSDRNAQRAADANKVLAATATYITNNSGRLPVGYADGKLAGLQAGDLPVDVPLDRYTSLQIKTGVQTPLEKDELWLVTGAACDGETGSTVEGTVRSYVVMYGKETSSGSFESECVGT